MAKNIDTRVVQLQFENREFERNIAKSQKSLEDLKEAMDFEETSSGLEKFSRAFNFAAIENNLQRLTDKFTGLGNATEYVMSRIRYSIESAAQSLERFIKSLSVTQISAGQEKYDQLNKSVMTIVSGGKYTEEQAYGIMERVMKYTDQTSHSFGTMVNQISALTSVGMGLEEAELLLEGIGNAATFAGKDAATAAQSMTTLSKALSPSAFLGYEQFLQMRNTQGVITDKWREQALEAAQAVGTLKKKNDKLVVSVKGMKGVQVTAQNLEDTLKYRWLTSEVLKEMYKNYQFANSGNREKDFYDLSHPEEAVDSFGKTAYLTGQRALTLADAFNAVRDSVSSGWMESFRLIFGDVTEAAEHFTNIADRLIEIVEKIKTFRNQLLEKLVNKGARKSFMELIMGDYENDIETGAVGILDLLDGAAQIISKGFWDFVKIFHPQAILGAAFDERWENNSEYRIYYLTDKIAQFIEGIKNFFIETKQFFAEEITVNGKVTTRLQMIHEIVSGISGALAIASTIMTEAFNFINGLGKDLDPAISAVLGLLAELGAAIFDTAQDTQKAGKVKQFFEDLRTALEPITTGINNVIISLTNLLRIIFGLDGEDKDRSWAFDGLGKALITIADIMSAVLGPILNFVSSVLDAFSVFKDGFNKETIQQFGKQVGQAFGEMFKAIADNLPENLSFIRDFIYDLFGLWDDPKVAEERSKTFGTFLHNLFTTGFGGVSELVSSIFGGFSLTKALETGLGFGSAMNFMSTIAGFFKNCNLYSILMGFLGAATVFELFNLIRNIKRAIRTIGGFFDDVGGNLMAGATGQYEWFSEKLSNIAKAIGIFALVIMGLGSMDTGKLIQGVIAFGVIVATVVLLFKYFSSTMYGEAKLQQTFAQQAMIEMMLITIAATIAIIAVAIGVLILAVTPLAAFGPKAIIGAVLAIGAILAMLGIFIKVMLNQMNAFTKSIGNGTTGMAGIGKMALMMLALGASVALLCAGISALVLAITPLALTGWGGIARAIIGIGAILGLLGIFIKLMLDTMRDFSKSIGGAADMKSIGKMALMMLALSATVLLLAAGIGALVLAITPLSLMGWEGLARAILGLGLIMAEIGLFIKMIQKLSADDKTVTVKVAGLTLFALSLGILIMALTPLAMMSWGGWGRAMLGLGIVLAELVGYMWLVKKADVSVKSMMSFAAFAFSLAILMFALKPIAYMDWGGWGRAMLGLGVVLAELVGYMWLVKKVDVSVKSMMSFIGFAASLAILMVSLRAIATLDDQQYVRGLVGMAAMMLLIVVILNIIKPITASLKQAGTTLLMLAGIAVAMVLFSIAFNEVKDVPVANIIAFAAGLSVLMVAIAFASSIISAGGIKGVLLLVLALAGIFAVIALMAPMIIGGIAKGLAEAAGQITLISNLMQSFSSNMNGVDESAMDKMKRLIKSLGEILTMAIAFHFAGGAFVDLTRAVSQLTIVSGEMITMTGRFDSVKESSVTHIKTLINKLKEILDGPLSGIGSYITTASNFSSVMFELGTGIEIFDNHTNDLGIDPENNAAIKTIQALAGCAGDLDIIAKMNIDDLTAKISGLGGAMILYAKGAKEATGMDLGEDTPDVTAAIGLMQAITQGLADENGIVIPHNMPDETSIGTFGAQLAALAAALIEFETAGQGLGDGTEKALGVLDFFQKLKQRLKETDFENNLSAIDSFGTGEEAAAKAGELETFGKNIEQLGLAIGKFATSTTYLDENGEVQQFSYENAIKAMDGISEVANKLPKMGDALSILTGKRETLTEFAGEIEAIGQALNDFHTNTTSMDEANKEVQQYDYSNAVQTIKNLADISNQFSPQGGLVGLIFGNPQDLTDLAGDIVALGGGLNQFSKSIMGDGTEENPGINLDASNEAIKICEDMVSFMQRLASSGLDKVGGLWRTVGQFFSGHDTTLGEIADEIGKMGTGIGQFGSGISGKFNNIEEITNALNAINSIIDLLADLAGKDKQVYAGSLVDYAVGVNQFLDGFLNGFQNSYGEIEGPYAAVKKIVELMDYVSKAVAEEGNGISTDNLNKFRLMTEAMHNIATIDTSNADFKNAGFNIATGIAEGIKNGTSVVTQAATNLAIETYNATMKALEARSPSRLFREVGDYIGLGMAIGIDDSTGDVVDSATGMTEKTIETARTLAATISQIMAEEADANPTISPILDLTNVENGASTLNGLFGRPYGLTLNGQNLSISANTATGEILPKDYTDSINKVDQEIGSLRTDIQELAVAMKNIKMVMNTGAVVGAIGPDMDRYLGQRGFYAARTEM